MTSFLRYPRTVLLTLALALLAPLAAKDVRHPATGLPAYAFTLPDDWGTQAADSGNLLLFDAKRATVMVILMAASSEPLDQIAKEALVAAHAAPASRNEPAAISGCAGFTWFSTVQNPKGITLTLEMTIVRIDPDHIASASLVLSPDLAPEVEATARGVRNGLTLVK